MNIDNRTIIPQTLVKITNVQLQALHDLMAYVGASDLKASIDEKKALTIEYFVNHYRAWNNSPLLELGLDGFIRAVYIGYEVVLTKEEKVKEIYNNMGRIRNEVAHPKLADDINAQMNVVKSVLNALEIEIEGINK